AIEAQKRARAIQPEIVIYRVFLTNHLLSLGDIRLRAEKLDEAAKLAIESAVLWTNQPDPLSRSAILLAGCVKSAGVEKTAGNDARKDRFGRAAVEILERAASGEPRILSFLRSSNQLDPIRDRNDFQALLRRLESRANPAKKAKTGS